MAPKGRGYPSSLPVKPKAERCLERSHSANMARRSGLRNATSIAPVAGAARTINDKYGRSKQMSTTNRRKFLGRSAAVAAAATAAAVPAAAQEKVTKRVIHRNNNGKKQQGAPLF